MPPMIEDTLDSYIARMPSGVVPSTPSITSEAHVLLPMSSIEPLETSLRETFSDEVKSFSSPLGRAKGHKRKGMKVTFKVASLSSRCSKDCELSAKHGAILFAGSSIRRAEQCKQEGDTAPAARSHRFYCPWRNDSPGTSPPFCFPALKVSGTAFQL